MLRQRLDTLVERFGLPPGSAQRLERLLSIVAEDRRAPTSVREPLAGVDLHLADSLSVIALPEGIRGLPEVADIGSGAGFPGIVLAIALPEARFDLIEASTRKCEFLRDLIAAVRVDNANVVCARVEQWAAAEGAEAYAGATVRAVGRLATLVEYAAPLLRSGGRLVALKGRRDEAEERQAASAAAVLGMQPHSVRRAAPFASSRNRHLYSYEKVGICPAGFPRRPGMARKRPLGGRLP